MTVRRCSFIFIGGAVWNRQLRIRFGNAIEFWEYGENILIEDCYFNNIYDSCITEQGSDNCQPAKNLVMRNNLFINYGMGAYEGRDRMLVDSVFENNLCIYAAAASRLSEIPYRVIPRYIPSPWDTISSCGAYRRQARAAASSWRETTSMTRRELRFTQ